MLIRFVARLGVAVGVPSRSVSLVPSCEGRELARGRREKTAWCVVAPVTVERPGAFYSVLDAFYISLHCKDHSSAIPHCTDLHRAAHILL